MSYTNNTVSLTWRSVMIKVYVLSDNSQIKELFKNNFVDIIKKKGKKVLEIDLLKNQNKKENFISLLPQIKPFFDYIILYSDCPEQTAKVCDIIVVLQNELLNGLSSILNKQQIVLLFSDNVASKNLENINSKVIDIGFSSQNTVNITHLDYECDNKVAFNLFFQRIVEDVESNYIIEKEVVDNYSYNFIDCKFLYVYPLITTLKVLFKLI